MTGGLGWGRLAGRNSFDNPLSFLGLDAKGRDTGLTGTGGQLESGRWFQGEASFFADIDWKVSDTLSFQFEYSPDRYTRESRFRDLSLVSQVNASVAYSYNDNLGGKLYVIGGSNVGVQLDFALDPKERIAAGGREAAPTL